MKPLTIAGAVVMLLCGAGPQAEAQGVASTFDQLSVLVGPGDKISVVDATGMEARGRLAKLSHDALTLNTEAGPRQFGEADVTTIRQRRGDSLVNGAVIGAVAGTAYVVTALALLGDGDGGDVIVPAAILATAVSAGLGAAAGAGIDALITRRQVIFRKPGTAPRVSFSPLLGHGRRGASISIRITDH